MIYFISKDIRIHRGKMIFQGFTVVKWQSRDLFDSSIHPLSTHYFLSLQNFKLQKGQHTPLLSEANQLSEDIFFLFFLVLF